SSAPRRVSIGFCAARSCFSFVRKAADLFSILLVMTEFQAGSARMLLKHQRYQKSRTMSGAGRFSSFAAWLALFAGLAGCAGAEAPPPSSPVMPPPTHAQNSTQPQNPTQLIEQAPTQALAPSSSAALYAAPLAPSAAALKATAMATNSTVNSGVAPQIAEQALIEAREAMQKKQWSKLDQLVPTAQAAPLVGSYARYWA